MEGTTGLGNMIQQLLQWWLCRKEWRSKGVRPAMASSIWVRSDDADVVEDTTTSWHGLVTTVTVRRKTKVEAIKAVSSELRRSASDGGCRQ